MIGNRSREPMIGSTGKRVGYIRNLAFKDINYNSNKQAPWVQGGTNPEALFLGLDSDHRIQNVVLENLLLNLPGGQWYTEAVGWAAEAGIDSGALLPNSAATRGQVATVMRNLILWLPAE